MRDSPTSIAKNFNVFKFDMLLLRKLIFYFSRFFRLFAIVVIMNFPFVATNEINCTFAPTFFLNAPLYSCQVYEIENYDLTQSINGISGIHREEMSNENVTSLFISDVGNISRLPRGLEFFFPNLMSIEVIRSGLKEISQRDLAVFRKLQRLSLHSNELETVDSDVFESNLELLIIDLSENKANDVLRKVFLPKNGTKKVSCDLQDEKVLDLQKEIRKLNEGKVEATKLELNSKKAQEDLKAENSNLTKTNLKLNEEIQKLKNDLNKLKNENKKLSENLSFAEEKLKTSAININSRFTQVQEDLKLEVANLTSTNSDLKSETQKFKIQVNELKVKNKKLTENLSIVEKKFVAENLTVACDDLTGSCRKSKMVKLSKKVDLVCEVSENSCNVFDLPVIDDATLIEKVFTKNLKPLKKESITKLVIWNHQTIFLPSNFGIFKNLKELSVSNSGLIFIDNSIFKDLKLTSLVVSYNKVKIIKSKTFSDLSIVKILDLSWNGIEILEIFAFDGLKSLEVLNMNGNLLTKFDSKTFASLESLKFLFSARNKLKFIAMSLFSDGNQIQVVDFKGNICVDLMVPEVKMERFKDELSKKCAEPLNFNCAFAHFKTTYTCQAENLIVSNPKITISNVSGQHFKGQTNDDVKSLLIKKQECFFLPTGLGLLFPNLENFAVDSSKLTQISSIDLKRMKKVVLLMMRKQKISLIEAGAFDDLSSLESLYLRFNEIENLPDYVFSSLGKLRLIHLSDNKLSTLKENFFPAKNNIQEIFLENNRFTKIEPKFLNSLKQTRINLMNSCVNQKYENLENYNEGKFWEFFGKISLLCS